MNRQGDTWVAVLPRPLPETRCIQYAIEAAAGGRLVRVPEGGLFYIAEVSPVPCAGDLLTASSSPGASIVVGVPPGRGANASGGAPRSNVRTACR